MNLLKHRSMRFYLVFFLILTMAIGGGAIAAFADSGTATTNVSGTTISVSGAANGASASATLNGTDTSASYTLPLTVNDSRGTGLGWALEISSTQFTTGGNNPHVLSTTASSITVPSSGQGSPACGTSSTCTLPTNSVSGYPLQMTADGSSTVKLYNAAVGTGLGTITLTPAVSIVIPANTYAGSYQSTVTLTTDFAP